MASEPVPNLSAFNGTRARLQRLRDAKLFSGWIQELSFDTATVTSTDELNLEPGDACAFEAAGVGERISFFGRLRVATPPHYTFFVQGDFRFGFATESMRKAMPDIPCVIARKDETLVAATLDISQEGLGVRCPKALPRGEKVKVAISFEIGEVRADAEVRYCRAMEDKMSYRIGLKLDLVDRVSKARWVSTVERAA